jgi:hypothetical protein
LFDADNHLWLMYFRRNLFLEEGTGTTLAGLKGHGVNTLVQVDDELFYAGTTKGAYKLMKGATERVFAEQPIELPQRCM